MANNRFRSLPAVNDVLATPALQALGTGHGHETIVTVVRAELDDLRARLRQGEVADGQVTPAAVAARVAERLGRELRPKLCPVINTTGILLHTNLGRAPMAEAAAQAAAEAARGYLNLELDLGAASAPRARTRCASGFAG